MAGNFFRTWFGGNTTAEFNARIEEAHDLTDVGRDAEAQTLCDELLTQQAAHPRLLHLKGVLALRAGDPEVAASWIARAISADPASSLFRFNLGNALNARGDTPAAATAFAEATRLNPDHAPSLFNLGKSQQAIGHYDDAITTLTRLNLLQPNNPAVLVELGTTCYGKAGRTHSIADYAAGLPFFTAALALPDIAFDAQLNARLFKGDSLHYCGRHAEALEMFREVLTNEPNHLEALVKSANCLNQLGRATEVWPILQRVLAIDPDHLLARSTIISLADYLPEFDASANTRLRFDLAAKFASPLRRTTWPNSPIPARRLKVGYVSPDLRTHVAMFLFEEVLRLHDKQQFEWFIYDATPVRDEKSAALRKLVTNWRNIDAQPLDELPAMIEQDQIDILVDLAGHTSNNRIMTFAVKPAPVQVSWLAYPGSTGLREIDYLISDDYTSPPHLAHHASEQICRLPNTRFSYGPPRDGPVPALPSTATVTFGCFNNILKLNARVFALWQRILDAVPGSRIVIKNALLNDPNAKSLLIADLEQAGIGADRCELRGGSPYLENFTHYHDIHIALDPFPFCGGLTSLDALWMGVPVVTLEQELMAGRQTLAFLHNIGHPELIAATPDDYVRIAVDLARDPARIKHYRETLREAMRASPLLDHAALTRNLESAYRQMWQRYCEQLHRPPFA